MRTGGMCPVTSSSRLSMISDGRSAEDCPTCERDFPMEDTYLGEELSRLKALCPPPDDSAPVRTATRGTGNPTIPVSHKALTDTYGAGCFDEFLWVFADGALNSHLDITER